MTRPRFRSALAAVAGAGLLGLAGCTDDGSGGLGTGTGTPGPTTSASAPTGTGTGTATGTATGPDACALLTAADIATVSGRQVGPPVSRSLAGASACQFDDIVVTRLQSSVTAAQFDDTVRRIASAVQGQVTPVTGLGDAAAYVSLLKEICVVRQPTFFCIAGLDQPQSEQLARTALSRL